MKRILEPDLDTIELVIRFLVDHEIIEEEAAINIMSKLDEAEENTRRNMN